jgi:hypothetical protein
MVHLKGKLKKITRGKIDPLFVPRSYQMFLKRYVYASIFFYILCLHLNMCDDKKIKML